MHAHKLTHGASTKIVSRNYWKYDLINKLEGCVEIPSYISNWAIYFQDLDSRGLKKSIYNCRQF